MLIEYKISMLITPFKILLEFVLLLGLPYHVFGKFAKILQNLKKQTSFVLFTHKLDTK